MNNARNTDASGSRQETVASNGWTEEELDVIRRFIDRPISAWALEDQLPGRSRQAIASALCRERKRAGIKLRTQSEDRDFRHMCSDGLNGSAALLEAQRRVYG
jgi:hypothetical protein